MLPAAIMPLWLMNAFFDQRGAAEVGVSQADALIPDTPGVQTAAGRQQPLGLKMSFTLSRGGAAAIGAAPSAAFMANKVAAWPAAARQDKAALSMSFFLSQANAAEVAPGLSAAQAEKKVVARQAEERHQEMLLNVEKLGRQKLELPRGDPFAAKLPPPRAAAAAPPPAAPQAPALPFVFFGRMVEDNGTVLFLSMQGRDYSVKLNDVLERDYRVDIINNDQVVFTYLPLNIQQTLYIGQDG